MKLDLLKSEFLTFLRKFNEEDLNQLLNYVCLVLDGSFERNLTLYDIEETTQNNKNNERNLFERISNRSDQIQEKIQYQILSLEASNILFDPELEAVITNEANEAASTELTATHLASLQNELSSANETTEKEPSQNELTLTQINEELAVQSEQNVIQIKDECLDIVTKKPTRRSPRRSTRAKTKCSKSKRNAKSIKYPMYVINHLTKEYNENKYPNNKKIKEIALQTKLTVLQVNKWFTDRRTKLKHTRSSKIPTHVVNQLIKFYNKNKYPNADEIKALSTENQVSNEQIFNWFRSRRHKLKQTEKKANKPNVIPEHITNYLIQKYNANKNPTRAEIEEIALETHLTTEKINNWFKKRRVQLKETKPNTISEEALKYLTEKYTVNKYPNADQILQMSTEIHLTTEQIFNWFRTRRQRLKETRQTKYPPEIINYMMEKFNTNYYPSAGEMQQIAIETSLSVKQVNQWFSDRRYKLNHKEIKPIEITTLQGQQILENSPSMSTSLNGSTIHLTVPTKMKKQRASRQGTTKTNGFPPHVVEYLNDKFEKNNYPSPDEIQLMVSETGLVKKQINQWFNDKRYRSNRTKSNKYPEHVIKYLIEKFTENNYPTTEEKHKIALETKLTTQQVNKWFEDRRYKSKPIDPNV